MKIVIVDFEDSFTFNIHAELQGIGHEVQVTPWTSFDASVEFDLLVLGPGPGHPHDYSSLFPLLKTLIDEQKKILGICLGHQIIWNLQDALVTRSKDPAHGEQIVIELNAFWSDFFALPQLVVQRYNSLAVLEHSIISDAKLLSVDNEVMVSVQKHMIGVQFHPESLGTKNRREIFRSLIKHFLAS